MTGNISPTRTTIVSKRNTPDLNHIQRYFNRYLLIYSSQNHTGGQMRILTIAAFLMAFTTHSAAEEFAGIPLSCEMLYKTEKFDSAYIACFDSAVLGNANAASILSKMYAQGKGVERSDSFAVEWKRHELNLRAIAAESVASASTESDFLAICLNQIKNEKYEDAATACKTLAIKGNITAQKQLAYMYDSEIGVERSAEKAQYWYTKAAEQGDADSAFSMAVNYSTTPFEKRKWLEISERGGHFTARNMLAKTLLDFAPEKSVELYKINATQPAEKIDNSGMLAFDKVNKNYAIVQAKLRLAELYFSGTGVLQDYAQAAKWSRSAATYDYLDAQIFLSDLYKNGNGVPKDLTMAHAWLNRAAALGSYEAKARRDLLDNLMTREEVKSAQEIAKKLP